MVDGHGLGVLREVGKLDEQPRPVAAALPHPDDAAAADLDVRGPHVGEGVEPVLVGAGGDDLPVVLRGGVEVVVVVVEPGPRERLRLLPGQHPEGRAGLHPEVLHRRDQLADLPHLRVGRAPPRGPHAEAGGPARTGLARRRRHLGDRQQAVGLDPRLVMDALRAVPAVLRTTAGLDAEQGAHLHLVGRMEAPVNRLRLEQEVVQRPVEERQDLVQAPVVPDVLRHQRLPPRRRAPLRQVDLPRPAGPARGRTAYRIEPANTTARTPPRGRRGFSPSAPLAGAFVGTWVSWERGRPARTEVRRS